mgnify:FL=1|jgi:hypothetical protein
MENTDRERHAGATGNLYGLQVEMGYLTGTLNCSNQDVTCRLIRDVVLDVRGLMDNLEGCSLSKVFATPAYIYMGGILFDNPICVRCEHTGG